jgi:hypothetical protein
LEFGGRRYEYLGEEEAERGEMGCKSRGRKQSNIRKNNDEKFNENAKPRTEGPWAYLFLSPPGMILCIREFQSEISRDPAHPNMSMTIV